MREKSVLQYLRDNPRFLRRHQSELTRLLRLAERDVVDLAGHQLTTLRDENTNLRSQLQAWYQAAANNEAIINFLHRYALRMIVSDRKTGRSARQLILEINKSLDIKLCKVIMLNDTQAQLQPKDRKRLEECLGLVRTDRPLDSFKDLIARGHWSAFLTVPVFKGKQMRAVIICGTRNAKDFPRSAHSDYAIRMGELLAAALDAEAQ